MAHAPPPSMAVKQNGICEAMIASLTVGRMGLFHLSLMSAGKDCENLGYWKP